MLNQKFHTKTEYNIARDAERRARRIDSTAALVRTHPKNYDDKFLYIGTAVANPERILELKRDGIDVLLVWYAELAIRASNSGMALARELEYKGKTFDTLIAFPKMSNAEIEIAAARHFTKLFDGLPLQYAGRILDEQIKHLQAKTDAYKKQIDAMNWRHQKLQHR